MTNLHSTTGHVPNISALLSAFALQHRGCAADAEQNHGCVASVAQVPSAEILGTNPTPSYSFTAQGLAAAAGNAVPQRNNFNAQGGTVAFGNPSLHGATTGGVDETPPLYRVP